MERLSPDLDTCGHILAGDLNIREGEERGLLQEGWSDGWRSKAVGLEDEEWIWKNSGYAYRYDRIYTHAGQTEGPRCLHIQSLPFPTEEGLSDHVALHAVFELWGGTADCRELQRGASSEHHVHQIAAWGPAVEGDVATGTLADIALTYPGTDSSGSRTVKGAVLGSAGEGAIDASTSAEPATVHAAKCKADIPVVQISTRVIRAVKRCEKMFAQIQTDPQDASLAEVSEEDMISWDELPSARRQEATASCVRVGQGRATA